MPLDPYCCPRPEPKCEPSCCVYDGNEGRDIVFESLDALRCDILPGAAYGKEMLAIPDGLLLQATREAVIDFAARTRYLRRIWRVDVQAGVQDYYIKVLDGERVGRVDAVYFGGRMYPPEQFKYLRRIGCEFHPPTKLIFDQAPCQDDCLGLEIFYHAVPTEGACDIDATVRQRYREAIQHGAWLRLQQMFGMPWANPNGAAWHERRYEAAVTQAKIELSTRFVTGHHQIGEAMSF